MRPVGVSVTLLLLCTLLSKISAIEDLYWEGEDPTEFLEVKSGDSFTGHLKRLKRGFFDFWTPFSTTEAPDPENLEAVTEDDEIAPDNGDDDTNTDGSGAPDNRVDTELREKTLRVTFVVMEPYSMEYSNRDSVEFQNFSKDLADAVNLLFESLPGSQRASLVRIQSRLSDNFSCKVTLDVVTSGYEDTDRITQVLRDHIRAHRSLGHVLVSDVDFSANVIDPGTTLETCDPGKIQCDDGSCVYETARCDGNVDCADGSDEASCPAAVSNATMPETGDTYDEKRNEENTIDTGTDNNGYNYNGNDQNGYNENNYDQETGYNPDAGGANYDPNSNTYGGPDTYAGGNAPDSENVDPGRLQPDQGNFDTNNNNAVNVPERGDQSLDGETATEEDRTFRPKVNDRENQVCPDDEMVCDQTRCVSMSKRCDGMRDCYDGTDEANCSPNPSDPKVCGEDDFRCEDGLCIPAAFRCNSVSDCANKEDEANCACREDEFRCSDGSCIELRKRCDNYSHCPDGSDERDCTCSSDQWQCDHGSCIKRSKRCDGRVDCPTDRSDERNCFACGKGDFKCDNGHCIPASKHCDRTHDCQDGSDERHCKYGTVCMAYQYKCTSGKCVQSESWCNGTLECDDGSDEMNCPCKRDQFTCQDGSCINMALRCNRQKDCKSGEDEFNCDTQSCPPDSFQCDPSSWTHCGKYCDGTPDCDNGEDEEGCPGTCNHECDGHCVEDRLICDGKSDCSDDSDEENCDNCDGVEDFRCKNGECINAAMRCNGDYDCRDYSDELDCNVTTIPEPNGCLENQFTCGDGQCIDKQFVCDHHPDCFDNTDEDNCRCDDSDDFQCRTGKCIPSEKVCDGTRDCDDNSDELNCGTTTPFWNPPYYPSTTPTIFTTTGAANGYPGSDAGSDRPGNRYDPNRPRYPGGEATTARPGGNNDYGSGEAGGPGDRYDQNRPRYPGGPGTSRPGGSGEAGGPGNRYDPNRPGYPGGAVSSRPGGSGETGGPGDRYDPNRPRYPGGPGTSRPGESGEAGGPGNRYDPNRPGYPGGAGSSRPGGSGEAGGPGDRYDPNRPGYPGGAGSSRPDSNRGYGSGETGSPVDRYDSNRPGYPGSDSSSTRPGGYGSGENAGYRPDYYPNRPVYPDYQAGSSRPGSSESDRRPYPGSLGLCAWYQWRCEKGHCIDERRRCDGRFDCPFDVSDEINCINGSTIIGPRDLNLKTYPNAQIIRYGGDVVFQCRDEGPLRAPVRWVREGGRPLKPGFLEKNGRLELFKVSMRDAGNYICQATGYLGNPSAEKQVSLTVEPAKPTPPPFYGCKPHEATCANGECIPKASVCDGRRDCSDNSDEDNCQRNGRCEPNEFECANHMCILKTWLCDSDDDCGDGSDEQACSQPVPGQACLPSEFACSSQEQCVPKSFHCDGQTDCLDGSDEISCAPVHVVRPPSPSNLRLNPGDTLTLTCEAVGVPVPLISWRLNWGHVPPNCESTSEGGTGFLTCDNMQPEHSGAYSCEAINNKGTNFAVPDAIVHVNKTDPCPPGYFNSEARSQSECIRCFCFGESSQCRSADLFTYNMPTPLGTGGTRLVGVTISPTGEVRTDAPINSNFDYQPLRNGAAVTKVSGPSDWQSWSTRDAHPYITLPETYNGNQLTSYGGKIRYSLAPHAAVYSPDVAVPTIIIKGKYGMLFHTFEGVLSGDAGLETRLTPENWKKPGPRGFEPASREDLMMALDNIETILLRGDLNNAGVNITDFAMESAQHMNVGLGAASLVEECTCPPGYEGLSCEKCAAGYTREKSGPWLGNCVREACPPGTYGDPASGYACRPCPCPLTNRENQFARTCALGYDGQVVCDCNPGYEGSHCEVCAPGYEGNPLLRGDSCKPAPQDNCDKVGTRQVKLLDECECKDNVQGRYCDQCKNDSFYLSADFRHGCALCFCSGVSQQCRSSNLRRKTTYVQFNVPQIVQDVKLYSSSPADPYGTVRYSSAVETDIKPDLYRGTVMVRNLSRSRQAVYYWSLPNIFAGDKVTSYGGYLRYTLQGVPQSASSSNSRNDPDVQLISHNRLTFHYVGQFTPTFDGTLNASVQLLERDWQRADGKEVSREHFLLALADVKTILIKASYSPDAQLATPLSASIETAEDNGDGPLALHVEQCVCPEGYVGTSCEDCAPGYTRSSSGLYLEHCGLCDCNGHSSICNPESGECYDCSDNTDGPHCEDCKPGYEHDYNGNCVRSETSTPGYCSCDPRGVDPVSSCDSDGNCVCKANVEGSTCDNCRPGTFGLDADNPQGCTACYCSGVTRQCHEGTHYTRVPMAAPIFGPNYGGYTLMDLNGENVYNDHFLPVPDKSELTYVFSFPPNVDLYWSLPVFPGNRVLSYNGYLSLKQEFRSDSGSVSEPGTDIVLGGDGISVYWSSPQQIRPGEQVVHQVPLRETDWYVLNTASPASRSQFMQVLKNLRRVLVRATLVRNILSTTIADVSMDTAAENFNGAPPAKGVELCMCPPGYTGTSCESCAAQYYKDTNGNCRECPCNGNDCQLDSYGQVTCNCRPPYTGPDCATIGLVMELHPTIYDNGNGTLKHVTLMCKYRAPEPLTIAFFHKGKPQWPQTYYNESVFHSDGWHGELVLHTEWDTTNQGEIYECRTFTIKGFLLGVLTTSLPEPGPDYYTTTTPRSPVPDSTVFVKITSPTIRIQEVGSSVNFSCEAQSQMTRNRLRVTWNKVDGYLPQGRSHVDEASGILFITQLQISDSGEYICQSTDGISTAQARATLKVPGSEMTEPRVSIRPNVNDYYEGDRVELECEASGIPTPTITWQRGANQPLPVSAEQVEDLFIIDSAREEDSGEYRCIGSNTLGTTYSTAVITIRPKPYVPGRDYLTVSPPSPTVTEGQSINVVCTAPPSVPAGTIDWIRQDGSPLLSNVRSDNGVLYIEYARPENQGVYICQSLSSYVAPLPVLVTVITTSTPSPSEVSNITVSVDHLKIPTGGSGTVDCNPQGTPQPLIKWIKHGGSFGPGASQRGNTLIVSGVTDDDQGYYMCEGSVDGVPVASIYVFVEVEKREPPRVEIWPPGEQSVALGSQYELHCRVLGGIPEPDVMWSRNGGRQLSRHAQMLPHNILRFEQIDVNDEGEYTCTATNVAGSESASASFKVRSPPEITITPSSYNKVTTGDSITVVCRANGYPEPLVSIKSSRDQRELVSPTPGIAQLRISSASYRDDGDYTCTASSAAGTIEDQFVITVEDRGDINEVDIDRETGSGEIDSGTDQGYDPDYSKPPSSLVALEGKDEITIECNSDPEFEIRWDRGDRQPLQPNAEQRGSRLIIHNLSKQDSGEYVCSIFNRISGISQQAAYTRLLVLSAPKITLRPPTQTVRPGQSPTVECVVEGDDIIDVLWRPYDGVQSSRVEIRDRMLIFHNIEVEDTGRYECIARNRIANASGIAEVMVTEDIDPAPSESHDNEQYAHAGAAVHLSCNVTQPNLSIKWTKDGRSLPRSVVQKHDGSLFIKLAQKSDSGRYVCHIQNQYGGQSSNYINLHIEGFNCPDEKFTCNDRSGCIDIDLLCDGFLDCEDESDETHCQTRTKKAIHNAGSPDDTMSQLVSIDQPRRSFRVGENVNVLCRSQSRGINVKWEKYGTIEYVDYVTYGDGAMLTLNNVRDTDAGVYRCTGTGPYGSTYDDFQLEVEGAVPDVGSQVYPDQNNGLPRTRYIANLKDSVDLPCTHDLEPPFSIEWSKEFSALPSEVRTNQPILRLERVTEADAGTYVCRISNNRATIETRVILQVKGVVPRFNGESWLSLPTLKDAYKQFDIEVSFKPIDPNGLILYSSQNQDSSGDYVALQLIDGVPQFLVDAGTGPMEVKGDHPLQLNTWHTVRLSRTNSRITMDVGQTGPFIAELGSNSQWSVLELNQPLYIGGVPYLDQLPRKLAGAAGFVGCVSMLVLGREEKNIILDSIEKYQISECDSCSPNLCLNGGVCQEYLNELGYICICAPGYAGQNCSRTGEACRIGLCGPGKCTDTADGYKCACPVTHSGKNCESKQNIEYPAFTGSAYFAVKPPETSRSLKMSMKIKAMSPVTDGIIMYCAESYRGHGGFTSLTVHNGRLEFTYDLGKGGRPVVLTSDRTLQPNEWADINIARVGALVSLKINTNQNYEQTLDSPNSILSLETPMFVGGVDESFAVTLNKNTGVTAGFSGCIKDLKLNGLGVDFMNSSIQSVNVQDCQRPQRGDIPESDGNCQCKNGGVCTSDYSACSCPSGFTGRLCETRTYYPPQRSPNPTNPCKFHPCRNGGTCKFDPTSKMNHTCDCPLGYAGAFCQMPLELFQSVGFNGNGYLELNHDLLRYDDLDRDPAVIAMAVHTTSDGVLLYQREMESSPYGGDYILLRVERGFVVLDWDFGSGISSVSIDNVHVTDGVRHEIIAKLLEDNMVSLSVDGNSKTGRTTGISSIMNADSNIYIGGIPDHYNVGRYPGLTGCIEQVELMSMSRGLQLGQVAVAGRNTQRCKEYGL